MKNTLAVTVVAWLAHAGVASAGTPAWCKDGQFGDRYDLKTLSSTDVEDVVETLVLATCKPNAEATAAAAQIEASRQAWGKKLGMEESDWADAVALVNLGTHSNHIELKTKDLTQLSPLDQWVMVKSSIEVAQRETFNDDDYIADMLEPNLTEVGRLSYIDNCLRNAKGRPVWMAICQGDVDAFDRAKFATQLRSDTTHPGENKMMVRLFAYGLAKQLKTRDDEIKAIIAKDAAYKQLFTAAAKGRALYASTIGTNKDLLALATRMDSANWFKSRKQYEGCEAPTKAAFEKVIADKVPASFFAGIRKDTPPSLYPDYSDTSPKPPSFGEVIGPKLSEIPELMFIIAPYTACRPKGDLNTEFLKSLLKYKPSYRGPRRAAVTAILNEKIVLDDMTEKIDYPGSSEPYMSGSVSAMTSSGGVVASTTDDKDHLVVSFAKQSAKTEDCIKSHYTKRVTRVNSDGSLSYELICDKYGIVSYDTTPRDLFVDLSFKPLLKKGVQFSADGRIVLAVWPSKDAKLPSHFLGLAVK